ncbi:hypothetical protein GPY61_02320 [Massilia sp. NEAU-DD11]|uniref:Uncharacterized protein n=1 Tax=Massilia cellulosiltytica TaxID=2683234 RepID=A0A7X3K5W3_9BURK|nr:MULTISPECIES: hypothetical protein [Telluria group]MVW58757.1 hypothetical protein [Telluria cellulosilytica]
MAAYVIATPTPGVAKTTMPRPSSTPSSGSATTSVFSTASQRILANGL